MVAGAVTAITESKKRKSDATSSRVGQSPSIKRRACPNDKKDEDEDDTDVDTDVDTDTDAKATAAPEQVSSGFTSSASSSFSSISSFSSSESESDEGGNEDDDVEMAVDGENSDPNHESGTAAMVVPAPCEPSKAISIVAVVAAPAATKDSGLDSSLDGSMSALELYYNSDGCSSEVY